MDQTPFVRFLANSPPAPDVMSILQEGERRVAVVDRPVSPGGPRTVLVAAEVGGADVLSVVARQRNYPALSLAVRQFPPRHRCALIVPEGALRRVGLPSYDAEGRRNRARLGRAVNYLRLWLARERGVSVLFAGKAPATWSNLKLEEEISFWAGAGFFAASRPEAPDEVAYFIHTSDDVPAGT